ncbi:MAG TPA: RNA methyltransferase [Candidatus Coprenecus stercoravium]|uniref:RNA methyltransferase n=1 Tax=Candidatus Coprenecus stercoravium TaxID=2840735 RepID=A0A9D2GN42_9BACT|nr:RNA methyltransferase [Candidatus Coprenecus stercoravium]
MNNSIETITSLQNPKVKEVTALQSSSSLRREKGLFVVEGRREMERCMESGFALRSLFYCPSVCPQPQVPLSEGARVFEVSAAVYGKMAYRGGTEGILAVVRGDVRDRSLEALDRILYGGSGTGDSTGPLIAVVESVEKPGNLGAMLRTADGAGVSAVIICDPHTDLYNPNLIRSSLGGVFTRNIAVCTSSEAIAWLKSREVRIITAQLQDSELYYDTDMTGGTALVFGTESTGLSDAWRQAADAHVRIPMLGAIDSLNVSVSMAVLCYEALRQRKISHHAK